MGNYAEIEAELSGFDACLFCLGISSSGMSEADYTRITFTYPLSAAATLSRLNPGMTFVFVSGSGADRSEKGRVMWARVKGRTEIGLPGHALQEGAYLIRSQIRVRLTFTPSFVVVLKVIVRRSPESVKWRSMDFPISPGQMAASR